MDSHKPIHHNFYYIYAHQPNICMSRSLKDCKNCLQQFESHYPHCPYCGQKADNQLTLGVLFNNTISNYFSVDARFFRSFIPLMFKPGHLAKEFVSGRRLLYLHPAQMYLFISVILFFLYSFISREQAASLDSALKKDIERSHVYKDSLQKARQDSVARQKLVKTLEEHQDKLGISAEEIQKFDSINKNNKGLSGSIFNSNFSEMEIDSMLTAGASDQEIYTHMGMTSDDGYFKKRVYKQILKFFKNKSGGTILEAFYDSIPLAMFILLPIFALILKVFYFRKGRFAHHLVFSFYFFAFLFMVFSLLVIANLIWDNFPGWIVVMVMLSTFFYLWFGVKRFYEQGYFISFIKSNVVSFVFLSLVLPFAFVIMSFMAFLFY